MRDYPILCLLSRIKHPYKIVKRFYNLKFYSKSYTFFDLTTQSNARKLARLWCFFLLHSKTGMGKGLNRNVLLLENS